MTVAELASREGFSRPVTGRSFRQTLWRLRFWLVIVGGLSAMIILAVTSSDDISTATLSTRNPEPEGAMAVAEILGDQGVKVREVTYLGRAMIQTPETTTLVITLPSVLTDTQISSIIDYPGEIVFLGIGGSLLEDLTAGLIEYVGWDEARSDANCSDADAIAAKRTTATDPRVLSRSSESATVCFSNADGYGTYVVVNRDDGRIRIITDPSIAMNKHLAKEGNAALVLRTIGTNTNVVWYTGGYDDSTTLTYRGSPEGPAPDHVDIDQGFLPTGTGEALFALGMAGLVAAIWRGRRMGPLCSEPLPIIVHASESARGRGRLYRRARAYGRASQAFRAAAAERMGRRLGVPRTAETSALLAAIGRATKRNADHIEALLYGPPPASERAMMDLVYELDALEKEVFQP